MIDMATMTLSISELEPIRLQAEEAQAETQCVVVCSKQERPDKRTVWNIFWKTAVLRRRFSRLTMRQAKSIEWLVGMDFTRTTSGDLTSCSDLEKLALKLDEIVADERKILELANSLGSEIRAWWNTSLSLLADQADYLDSIAESLHVAANPECTSLLAVALQEIA